MQIVLASASPRRRELIRLISDDTAFVTSAVDETVPPIVLPEETAEFLACKKAAAVAKQYTNDMVVGADTVVLCDDTVLGKPKDSDDAYRMLSLLSGRTHRVITGCALFYRGKSLSFSVSSFVTFYPLSGQEVKDYIATGEPFDKAGAYGIQGKGALLVKEISGDYFNIVGLPVAELNRQIKRMMRD